MRTVNEVSKLTGVSIRTLHYYDSIGLLKPTKVSDSGYRLYSEKDLEKLQYILLFRELQFPLKDILKIITSANFDKEKAIEDQIELLKLQREHIDNLISLANEIKSCEIKNNGVKTMKNTNFEAFDTSKIEAYSKKAKEKWGNTAAFKEYESKADARTKDQEKDITAGIMDFFVEFGKLKNKNLPIDDAEVLECAKALNQYITDNFYDCTKEIFSSLADMYAAGGEFTENIDKAGGKGTAAFAADAIKHFCKNA